MRVDGRDFPVTGTMEITEGETRGNDGNSLCQMHTPFVDQGVIEGETNSLDRLERENIPRKNIPMV